MLGELIIEERGKVTGRRILDSQAGKMETSFTATGKVKGAEGMDMGKYLRECHNDKKMIGRFTPNLFLCRIVCCYRLRMTGSCLLYAALW